MNIDAAGALTLDGGAASNITTSVGALTLNGAAGVDITSTLDVTGVTNINNTTTSTNSTTGALVVDGGVGIAGNLNVGGTVTTNGLNDLNNGSNIDTIGGNRTINSMSGRFRILSGFDTDVIITNSFVTSDSIVICTISSANSSGNFIRSAIPSSGSFTVTIDAGVDYYLDINFLIIN
jgi:hypothetical protein